MLFLLWLWEGKVELEVNNEKKENKIVGVFSDELMDFYCRKDYIYRFCLRVYRLDREQLYSIILTWRDYIDNVFSFLGFFLKV